MLSTTVEDPSWDCGIAAWERGFSDAQRGRKIRMSQRPEYFKGREAYEAWKPNDPHRFLEARK